MVTPRAPEERGGDGIGGVALVDVVLQHQAAVEGGLVVRLVLVRCMRARGQHGAPHVPSIMHKRCMIPPRCRQTWQPCLPAGHTHVQERRP